MIRMSFYLLTEDVLHLSHDGWSLRRRTHAGLASRLHRSKFWTILHDPSCLCLCSLLNVLDHECLFRGVMLPRNAQGLGWDKPASRVKVRTSDYHDDAKGGMVTGSESSVHELRANSSTL